MKKLATMLVILMALFGIALLAGCDGGGGGHHGGGGGGGESQCADGLDDDGDGLIDCLDDDCACVGACPCPELDCGNGVDDDTDGDTDCSDSDCLGTGACPEDCANGNDDDGDTLVDCADVANCIPCTVCGPGNKQCGSNAATAGLCRPHPNTGCP